MPRPLLRNARTAIVAFAALGVVALAGSAGAAASAGQTTFFEAPRDLTAQGTSTQGRVAALNEIASLGIHALRVNLHWYDVAPGRDDAVKPAFDATDPAAYSWGAYGQVIDDAKARGWTVLISPSAGVPKWATASGIDTVTRPKPAEFELFAQAVAKRFAGPKVIWSIWNEPNLLFNLAPQLVDGKYVAGRLYRDLFIAGRKGIRTAQPGATVLFGETAPSSLVADRQKPIAFLRDALCVSRRYKFDAACGRLTIDGVAHHPYRSLPGIPTNTEDVTYHVIPRLTRALDRMAAAGAINAKQGVYLTQFGIQSLPDESFGVPAQRQLEERARAERLAFFDPRVKGFSQYLLSDDLATGPRQWAGSESGLRYAAGAPKPALAGFRLVLDVLPVKGGRVSIWGLVRPATKPTTVIVERRTGKRFVTWKKLRTDSEGSFVIRDRRRAGAEYRLRWSGPDGRLNSPAVAAFKG